jgi:hypothetical protein
MCFATPDPCRARGKVDGKRARDADQISDQIEDAKLDNQPHDSDIHQERQQGAQVELREPKDRQCRMVPLAFAGPPRSERPHLVEHVVVRDRQLRR